MYEKHCVCVVNSPNELIRITKKKEEKNNLTCAMPKEKTARID